MHVVCATMTLRPLRAVEERVSMTTEQTIKMPAWSYSSVKLFETCPRKYEAERITKEVKFTDSEVTIYGKALHLAAEEYIRDGKPIPERFKFIEGALAKLSDIPGEKHCELKFGIAKRAGRLEACDFFAVDVWFRGVADLLIISGDTARVIDYKTNKSAKYADTRQLALMAACVFLNYPEVKTVKSGLLFVVCNAFIKENYTFERRFDIFAELDSSLMQLAAAYETAVWNPKPNGLCKQWCEALSCPHNGKN